MLEIKKNTIHYDDGRDFSINAERSKCYRALLINTRSITKETEEWVCEKMQFNQRQTLEALSILREQEV